MTWFSVSPGHEPGDGQAQGTPAKKKGAVRALVVLALIVVAVSAVVINVETRLHAVDVASFYRESFFMHSTSDPKLNISHPSRNWNSWATLFWRVEYVMDFPPESERKWAVLYIRPTGVGDGSDLTQFQVNTLNEIIADDPGIVVGRDLSLPLTKEQVVSRPKAVLDIIKQFDRKQWDRFYDSPTQTGIIDVYARDAGIEPPTE